MGVVKLLETDIQKQVMNYLRLLQNRGFLYFFRIYNGPKIHSFGKRQVYTKNPSPGLPDLMILLPNKVLYAELKSAKGVLSEAQLDFKCKAQKMGHEYVVWKSIEDCVLQMNALGLKP